MDYIDAATTGTLFPNILPIMDLKKMLSYIEETLPSTLHLPISSEDTLHFYHYLHTHVLIANNQFLLLINVPIQDKSQQLSIYKTFMLDIPHGNFTVCYDVKSKYLRITQDETVAVDILPQQPRICLEENGQFLQFLPHFNHLQTHHLASLPYMPKYSQHFIQMFFTNQEIFGCHNALTTCPQCLDINNSTLSSSSHGCNHMPGRDTTVC